MSIGRITTLILLYLVVLYFIFPHKPNVEYSLNSSESTYLLQDYNKQMFKNINFNSSHRATTSHALAKGAGYSGSSYSTQTSPSNYSYSTYTATINTEIQGVTSFQPATMSEQSNSGSNKRSNTNETNDYSKIPDLNLLADVLNRGNEKTTAIFGNTDNNVAIGLQNSNSTIFQASSTEDGGSNPEGDPLPLTDDLPIYLALISIYFTAKKTRKKSTLCIRNKKNG